MRTMPSAIRSAGACPRPITSGSLKHPVPRLGDRAATRNLE